jgi:hypothetical protein
MSENSRHFVLAYALLVVLPLASLGAVLKLGRHLSAPRSVDGVWKVQLDPAQLASFPCGKSLLAAPQDTFAISQSGRTFTLTSANPASGNSPQFTAVGTIEGRTLQAKLLSGPGESSREGCGELSLEATLDLNATSKTLVGTLAVDEHTARFRALLQPAITSRGGR